MKTLILFLVLSGVCFADEAAEKNEAHLRDVQAQLLQMKSKMKQLEGMTQALEQLQQSEHAKSAKAKLNAKKNLSKFCDIGSAAKIKDCLMKTLRDLTSMADNVTDDFER